MLGSLFPKIHRVYEQSPSAAELECFACWLQEVGYTHVATCDHLFRLKQILEHAIEVVPDALVSADELHQAFGGYCTNTDRAGLYRGTERAYARFLATRGRLLVSKAPAGPFDLLLQEYRQYLTEVRGFTRSTIDQHLSTIGDFLGRVLRHGEQTSDLTAAHVERYVALRSREVSRQTLQHTVARLRAFLRLAFTRGVIRTPLDTIDTPRTYRGELPPRALDWCAVQRLLRSIDRTSPAGWRDYAILHLMAHYGLRPSEIVALTFDSFDWRAQTFDVEQRKTRSTLVLPLANRSVAILRGYLLRGRPASADPHLFLRLRCPAGSLQHTAVCDIFYKRARRSGLALDGYSSYCLRHAFAMRLLTRGVGVKAIGDLLGHRSLESTCVYLRLDTARLRSVALEVPCGSGRRTPS